MTKNIILTLTSFLLIFTMSSLVQAGDRDSKTLLTGECLGCHSKQNYCRYLGKDEKFWKGMIGLMESNGATLSALEKAELITFLSLPHETAKEICK